MRQIVVAPRGFLHDGPVRNTHADIDEPCGHIGVGDPDARHVEQRQVERMNVGRTGGTRPPQPVQWTAPLESSPYQNLTEHGIDVPLGHGDGLRPAVQFCSPAIRVDGDGHDCCVRHRTH
ncbi:MAG TPA: hypothetical protein PK620_17105 [Denitromonas sp.]|nr:hypothetical protein [Denitromonas sp.]